MDVPVVRGPLEVQTIPRMFVRSAQKYADKVVHITDRVDYSQRFTYAELLDRVKKIATTLKNLGFKPGDKICVTGENCSEWETAYLAIQWIGCTVVPLDNNLKVPEIRHIMRNSDSVGVFATPDLTETVDEAIDEIDRKFTRIGIRCKPEGWLSFERLIGEGAGLAGVEPTSDLEAVAAILYTSGTTGQAKGVMLTHKNIGSNVSAAYQVLDFGEQDTVLSALPIYHSFGATCDFLCAICCGCTIVFSSINPQDIRYCLEKQPITTLLMVPLAFEKIVIRIKRTVRESSFLKRLFFGLGMGIGAISKKLSRVMFSSIRKKMNMKHMRFVVSGGAALAPWVSDTLSRLGIPILQGYGLTETSPVLAVNRLANPHNESVGYPLPGFEVRIDEPDENGNGEIVVKGPSVMKGYYKNPQATREVLSEDGWLRTGDLGRFDERGRLYVTGRAKNLIVTAAGKNVYPEELEAVVGQNDYIEEIVVYGHHNQATGREDVHAVIYPNYELLDMEHPKITEDELEALIREQVKSECTKLADYKRIKRIKISQEELPKTTKRSVKRYLFAKKPIKV